MSPVDLYPCRCCSSTHASPLSPVDLYPCCCCSFARASPCRRWISTHATAARLPVLLPCFSPTAGGSLPMPLLLACLRSCQCWCSAALLLVLPLELPRWHWRLGSVGLVPAILVRPDKEQPLGEERGNLVVQALGERIARAWELLLRQAPPPWRRHPVRVNVDLPAQGGMLKRLQCRMASSDSSSSQYQIRFT